MIAITSFAFPKGVGLSTSKALGEGTAQNREGEKERVRPGLQAQETLSNWGQSEWMRGGSELAGVMM